MEHWVRAAKEWIRSRSLPDARTGQPVCAFVYDLAGLRRHAAQTVEALPSFCHMYYAMKANSDKELLRVIRPHVRGFEAASIGEVRKALAVDSQVPVIFGGPGKTDEELREALQLGVERIHVESLHELRRLSYWSKELGREITVLLRVNLKVELPQATLQMGGRATQFGMEEADLDQAAALLSDSPHLRMAGFHLHSISNQLDAEAHLLLLECYIERAKAWNKLFRMEQITINAGGGIGVNYSDLERQFDWRLFTNGLRRLEKIHSLPDGPELRIDFECGRYLTAFCGVYATEVIDVKSNHGKTFAVVRGGTQHFRLPVSWRHNHPFDVLPVESWPYPYERPEAANYSITVVGQLCTPKDVFAEEVSVSRIRSGDIVLFALAGAYGWAISHHEFLSHPHPEMVYWKES
ncbi:type III PLP-dependent enzyme [Paenibacillus sedimenti]|uniref:Type III PLP-dependent enzyme n=1 Tax=Paenibacillus sedimenti TaxID=2770274 RepID=A0A926KWP1_9BACL|nr:type III PLP-dependent enzyme [Paenibacillus sedimenti]MBD0383534.1 type III PLP-dependent enzyme [Paenibacillus sedimenti]